MQNDNTRITTILTALLIFIMVVVFFVGVGFLVHGWISSSNDRSLVAGVGQNFTGMNGFNNPQACSDGQYTRWTGVSWICANDRVGGGGGERGPQGPQGIQGPPGPAGQVIYANTNPGYIPPNNYGGTPQTCYAGEYSRWNGNYWTCAQDQTGNGNGGNYGTPVSCSSGQASRWTGSYWTCENIQNGGGGGGSTYYAGTGLTLNGSTFSVSGLQSCSQGQFSRWTGSSWVCETPSGSGGGGSGPQGPKGDTGPQGPKGDKGDPGSGGASLSGLTQITCSAQSMPSGKYSLSGFNSSQNNSASCPSGKSLVFYAQTGGGWADDNNSNTDRNVSGKVTGGGSQITCSISYHGGNTGLAVEGTGWCM